MTDPTDVREAVRARYAAAAADAAAGEYERGRERESSGCGAAPVSTTDDREPAVFGRELYEGAATDGASDAALDASLGCGVPTAVADLHPGETVLDLGSGAGADVLISARRVAPGGRAIGLDMTPEMLALARRNAAEAGVANAHFLKGRIEEIPLPAETVDVVISNCVVNLSTDKAAVLAEVARVLKPGGRVGISDVVAEDRLSPEERAERGSYVGCIAGALARGEYEAGLQAAGLEDVRIEFTHEVADGLHGAIVQARKPLGAAPRSLPLVASSAAGCC